jgi:putative addiction module CopG family antidote
MQSLNSVQMSRRKSTLRRRWRGDVKRHREVAFGSDLHTGLRMAGCTPDLIARFSPCSVRVIPSRLNLSHSRSFGMSIHLNPRSERRILQKVESGLYRGTDEVVEAALHLLDEQERLVEFRAAIAAGDEQIARGEVVRWTPDLMDRLKREAAANVAAGRPIKRDVQP